MDLAAKEFTVINNTENAENIVDQETKLRRLEDLIVELQQRVEDMEFRASKINKLPYISPNSTTQGIIDRVNHIITYLNEGVTNG